MSMPVYDWQFWVVTAAAAIAAAWLIRGALPATKRRRRQRGQRTTLTLHGKVVR